jgi:hypothetical protein
VDFPEGKPVAHVVLLGSTVPADLVIQWQEALAKVMPEAELQLVQNDGPSGLEDLQRMVNLYAEGQTALSLRDAELVKLRTELSNLKDQDLPASLPAEILAQAPDVTGVEVANRRFVGRNGIKRVVPWVDVQMAPQDSLDSLRIVALEQQIGAWLLLRLDADTLALQIRAN